jgi:hypothetical protein
MTGALVQTLVAQIVLAIKLIFYLQSAIRFVYNHSITVASLITRATQ